MRPLLALILTIFTLLGAVLSVNADLTPLHFHKLRDTPPSTNSSTSSTTSSTATSSSTSASTTASPSTGSSSTQSTSTSTTSSFSFSSSFSSSSDSSSSSFSTSSLPTSTQTSSSSQDTSSSSQSSQTPSSTSSFATNDTTSTSLSSQTRTTFTSTASDGSLFTVTAVVSSPSGGSGSGNISTAKQGFFANTGAVAGTFVVVGLVGTGVFICVFLWALRRYRRHKRYQAYFDDEVKEFNQPRERGGTPEATLPDFARESPLDTPLSSSPTPNMIERLHGTVPNVSYDTSQYQAEPGEFDPYQSHGGAYAYSDDQVAYGHYPGSNQPGNMAYAYQPGTQFNGNTGQYQAVAEPSHAPQGAVDSLPRVDSNHQIAHNP